MYSIHFSVDASCCHRFYNYNKNVARSPPGLTEAREAGEERREVNWMISEDP